MKGDSTMIAEARRDLPNFPAEIFRLWLNEYVLRSGWPPNSPHDQVPTNSWANLFAHKPVDYWRNVRWEIQDTAFDKNMFTQNSQNIISDLIMLHGFGLPNRMTRVLGGKETYNFHQNLMRTEGRFIGPPLLLKDRHKYELMDGCHRVSALLGLKILSPASPLKMTHQAWVAFIP